MPERSGYNYIYCMQYMHVEYLSHAVSGLASMIVCFNGRTHAHLHLPANMHTHTHTPHSSTPVVAHFIILIVKQVHVPTHHINYTDKMYTYIHTMCAYMFLIYYSVYQLNSSQPYQFYRPHVHLYTYIHTHTHTYHA